jgi:hypothetical protein
MLQRWNKTSNALRFSAWLNAERLEPAIPVLTKRSEHPQMRTAFSRPAPASEDASLRKLEAKAGIAGLEQRYHALRGNEVAE